MGSQLRLSIDGMHCGACVRRVTEVLQKTAGVELGSVEVGSAQMSFDPKQITPEDILAAVNGIGFTAHLAK